MKQWLWGLFPIMLLAGFIALFFIYGPSGVFMAAFPPVEELTIERVVLPEPDQIVVHVINGGPDPVTVAQVTVDEAFWKYTTDPEDKTIPRLGRMRISIPYPWVEGDTHEVVILTSTGLTFGHEIAVAIQSPRTDWTYFGSFALLGIYAGVIPVFLGSMSI